MKRYFSAAAAAAALFAFTGCTGSDELPTQVSTSDPSAGITSNYTSQSLQAETVTSSIEEKTIETAITETASAETETVTVLSTAAASTSAENNASVTSTSSSVAAAKTTTSTKQSSNGNQPAETTSSSSSAVSPVQTTTTSETTSQFPETTTRPAPSHDKIIDAYIKEVEKKINSMITEGSEDISVEYTLFDMDENGIPELIMNWGSSNDAYQVTIYTYDEFGTKVVSDGMPGTHAVFASIPADSQFILAYSDVDKGDLYWLDYEDLDLDKSPHVELNYENEETFESKTAEYTIEKLPYAKFTYSYEENTSVYSFVNGETDCEEIAGRDFSFIQNYQF